VFLALLVATSAVPSGTVSLTIPAAPVNAVLKQLSQITGKRYEARGDVGDEIVCVRVTNVNPDDLRAKLAEVTGGEWRPAQDSQVLVSSPAFEKRERDEAAATDRAGIQKSLQELSAQFNRNPTFNKKAAQEVINRINVDVQAYQKITNDPPSVAEMANRQNGTPAQRLLIRLLQAIPLDDITGFPDGAKVVYSSQPNRMQRAFPSSSGSLISQFVGEEKSWESTARTTKLSSGGTIDIPLFPETFKINLIFNNWEGGPGASADLAVYDANHKIILSSNVRLDGWDEERGRQNTTPPQAKPGEQRVEEGQDADELRRLVQRDNHKPIKDEVLRASLMAKWKPKLIDPAQFEPLAYVPGALWQKLAVDRKVNLVANAYEEAFSSYADTYEGPRTPSTILQKLRGGCDIVEENGWMTIRPKFVLDNRLDRIERPAIGALIRSSLLAGGLTIDGSADYMANHSKRYGLLAWDGGYLSAFFRGSGPTSIFALLTRRDELRFYGLLSPINRSQLPQRPVRLSELPPAAKQHLEKMVYWNGWASDEDDGDPTEILPNGIPGNGLLTLVSDKNETLVQPYTDGAPLADRNYSPWSAARLGKQFGLPNGNAEAMAWNRFRVVRGHRLSFRLDYAPGISKTFDLLEVLDPHGSPLTYDQLPADFRAEVERAKKATKERPPVNEAPPPPM